MTLTLLRPRCCQCRATLHLDLLRGVLYCANRPCHAYDLPRPGRNLVLVHTNSHCTWVAQWQRQEP
jgi:hypothetical protein